MFQNFRTLSNIISISSISHHNLFITWLIVIATLISSINCRSLINGNYKDFCDETYSEDSSIVQRGYQLLVSVSSPEDLSNQLQKSKNIQSNSTKYLLINNVINFNDCVKQCCINEFNCDVAFFNHSSNVCLHIICNFDASKSDQQCPLMKKDDKQPTSLLQIRSSTFRESTINYRNELSPEKLINVYGAAEKVDKTNLILESKYSDAKASFHMNRKLNNLLVVVNKNSILQLPNNSITINAFVQPPSNQYVYKWTLVSRPSPENQQDSGSWEEQNTDSLKLSKLIEGTYIFNITVTSPKDPMLLGQESVNITVLPPKRINSPPQAIIKPENSTVQLPRHEFVLDGSQSIDDDKIVNWKWELVNTPIGFALSESDLEKQTLQLKNLIAGNYTFKLTVIDSDNQTSSAKVSLVVLKEKDYPPTAVVSQDQIIFLPQNSVILYGNESTDDKKIMSYEWTLIDDNQANKPINNMDMSGVKTSFLSLSNLKVGVYKAVLKVTDSSNQTSTAETHVFVKPEIDIKPETIIKPENQKVYMPLKVNVTLDGSSSKDVSNGGIVKWKWSQLNTQNERQVILVTPNNSTTNVTGLVPGQYTFLLEIMNSKNLSSNATATIEVFQNENDAPIADAGGNQTIILPRDIVILNGSRSHDDLIDLKYQWTRTKSSLAIGDVIGDSDKSAILKLSNLIQGRYIWQLTVEDNQGAKSSDLAVIDVQDPPNFKDFVEILLNVNYKQFRDEQKKAIIQKVEILLSSNIDETVKLANVKLYPIYDKELVLIQFTVQLIVNNKASGLTAPEVVKRLRLRLRDNKSLIDSEIILVRTVICQNSCSNHGRCVEKTKECICDSFWMQNFLRIHFGDARENCDWSVIYFLIFSVFALILACTVMWSFLCFFVRNRKMHLNFSKIKPRLRLKKTRKRTQYTLLKQNGLNNKMDNQTSDDSDSDIEHRNKLKKNIETKIKIKNGTSKSNYKDSSSESEVIEYDFNSISRRGYS